MSVPYRDRLAVLKKVIHAMSDSPEKLDQLQIINQLRIGADVVEIFAHAKNPKNLSNLSDDELLKYQRFKDDLAGVEDFVADKATKKDQGVVRWQFFTDLQNAYIQQQLKNKDDVQSFVEQVLQQTQVSEQSPSPP